MIGKTIGHYRIVEQLGAGGMGIVYRAKDARLGRQVALKSLPEELARDPDALARLRREARAASALDHPSICTIYDIVEEDGGSFIVMQLLEGRTLRERGTQPFTADDIVDIALQVADGLDAAHAKGILHRDITPANILLTARGQAKILDFGLAKVGWSDRQRLPAGASELPTDADAGAGLTRAGATPGTVAYMSPEQARGQPLDARTDLFSLGAVLYEVATGRRAFQGGTAAIVFNAILEKTPPAVRAARPDLPPELERIIGKLLEKDRALRYQSAAELRSDLGRLKRELASGAPSGARDVRSRARRPLLVAAGLAVLLAAAGGGWLLRRGAPPEAIDSVAVLPFVNVSGDPDTEYLSDGIAESLTYALTRLGRLRVVPRSTAFRYKGDDVDPQTVGRALGVRAVVTGRVMLRGDTLVVGAELIDVAARSQLWGEQYNRRMADILAVQSELTQRISDGLRLGLSGDEERTLTGALPSDPAAYELYLKGLYHRQKTTEAGFYQSLRYFEQAVQLDPNYAPAYAGLADTYNSLGYLHIAPPRDVWPQARTAALAALRLDDRLAPAYAALAAPLFFYDLDREAAKQALDRAIELDPTYAITYHWYAHYHFVTGPELLLAASRRAVELDPLDLMLNAHLLFMEAAAFGSAERLVDDIRKVREIEPGFWAAHTTLGSFHVRNGRFEEGLPELERGAEASNDMPLALLNLGLGYAAAGRRQDAERVIERLQSKRYAPSSYIAQIFAVLGDIDPAFEWYDRAYEERASELWLALTRIDDAWRSDPRFAALLARVESPPL